MESTGCFYQEQLQINRVGDFRETYQENRARKVSKIRKSYRKAETARDTARWSSDFFGYFTKNLKFLRHFLNSFEKYNLLELFLPEKYIIDNRDHT